MNRNRTMNEGSFNDFLMDRGTELREARQKLREMNKLYDNITDFESYGKDIDQVMKSYDKNVGDTIEHWIGTKYFHVTPEDIASFAIQNQDRFGTEARMIIYAIDDFYETFMEYAKPESEEPVNEAKKTKKDNFVEPFKKLKNLKHFHELSYDGDTTKKSNVNDDSWVKGTKEDLVRPMFKNLPDTSIRPSYDVLRTGSILTLFGRDCRVEGLENGELTVSVMGKDDKHEIQKYDVNDVLKEIQKNNKKEKKSKK